MSYNIDTFKIKRLENLVIPLKAIYEGVREDWMPDQPVIENTETNLVSITCGCGQEIIGFLKEGNIHVTKLNMYGEGSGTWMGYFENSLKKSTGVLEAVRIWEGGESIDRLIVENGKVKIEDVEL